MASFARGQAAVVAGRLRISEASSVRSGDGAVTEADVPRHVALTEASTLVSQPLGVHDRAWRQLVELHCIVARPSVTMAVQVDKERDRPSRR